VSYFVTGYTALKFPCYTDIWGHMLFWSLLMSVLIYAIGGVSFSLSVPVLKKKLLVVVPLLYVLYGLFRLLFVEAIACELGVGKMDISVSPNVILQCL